MTSTTKRVLLISDDSDQRNNWQRLTERALLDFDDSKCEVSQATGICEALTLLETRELSENQFAIVLVGPTKTISLADITSLIEQQPEENYVVIPQSVGVDHEAELELFAVGAHAVERELTSQRLQLAFASAKRIGTLREQIQRHIEFSRTVSHDLKGPLNQLGQFCTFLRDDATATSDERKVWMDFVISNAKRLMQMIGDLDRFFRLESPHVETKKCDLADVMALALDKLDAVAPSDIVVKDTPSSIVVNGNMSLLSMSLRQIIVHRLESSRSKSSTVSIDCKVKDGLCCINIRDNGSPVADSEAKTLFEPFSNTSLGYLPDGQRRSGLEMAFGKRIVEAHGGTIDVSSNVTSGNCISVSLPHCV